MKQQKARIPPPSTNRCLLAFRSAYIFDVSQTEGPDLPKMHEISGDAGENHERIVAFIKSQGIELVWSEKIAPALGVSYGGRIAILPGQSKAEEFSTLIHELAHEMLHKAERRTTTTKVVKETEAEAVCVCGRQGRRAGDGQRIGRLHPALPRQRFASGGELGSRAADLRCDSCRSGAARRGQGQQQQHRGRSYSRCRTSAGGLMQTILRILKQAGGWHHGLYLKIENPPYMALVIEATDESGPCGLPAISVCHYGEQNGDLMRDPEMCFELGLADGPHLNAFYYRNDYVGVEQWSRTIVRDHYVYLASLHQQHERFAKVWDNNLRLQGFAEAFEQQHQTAPRA